MVDHLGLLLAGRFGALWDELRSHARWHGASVAQVAMSELLKPPLMSLLPREAGWAMESRRRLRGYEPPPTYPEWVRPEFAERIGLSGIVKLNEEPRTTVEGHARRIRYRAIFMHMHMRGVVWSERTAARFGLGFADPWSDRRLAEFILAVPQWRVQRVREPKRLARLAMRGVMPEKVRRQVGKISPEPVYERAIRERAKGTITDLITDSQAAARGYVDGEMLQKHYLDVQRGGADSSYLWWVLTLEMWLRRHWT